jgi:O-Antigen ligase
VDEARAGWPRRAGLLSGVALTLLVGGVFFVLAYDNGSYDTTTWAAVAVLVWWTLGLVAVGVLPGRRPPRAALVVGALLSLLAVWALVSTQWAADADAAYLQAARVALYAGAFFLVASTITRKTAPHLLDGIALAIVAIALVALGGRLFSGLAATRAAGSTLPAVVERLSWPVGYWNGLAMLVALALPLLLRNAAGARSRLAAAAAVAAIAPIVADVYLASSRGGAAVGIVAVATFLVLCRDRLRVAAAAAVGVAGGIAAVLVLESRPVLVDGPFGSHGASVAGREVAPLLAAAVAAVGVAWFVLDPLVRRIPALPRRVAVALGAGAVVAVVVLAAVSHPVARVHAFSRPPVAPDAPRFVRAHLVSGSGSGRWQFWTAAVDEWRSAPVIGSGAGSFAAWWAEHGSLTMFVRNAHSLYLESLGELGAIGFLLAAAVWLGGCVIGVRTCRRTGGELRASLAAATAVSVAFAVGAGLDWLWQLPAVSLVGVSALPLALGSPVPESAPHPRPSARAALAGLALVVVVLELIPLLAGHALAQSRRAAVNGQASAARDAALRAHALEPWAIGPLEQLALLAEARGDLAEAQRWIDAARRADVGDWQVRLLAARIETRRGAVVAARGDLRAARRLDPRSPLFAGR